MTVLDKSSQPGSARLDLDLLRARLESDIQRPAALAFVSATDNDDREATAKALANSLAKIGYATLYVDTSASRNADELEQHVLEGRIEDLASNVMPNRASDEAVLLDISGASQRTTSLVQMQATLAMLRTKFDYIVINADHTSSRSFATSILANVDAVLATVSRKRRSSPADRILATELSRLGSRFLGVLVIETAPLRTSEPARRKTKTIRREIAEWPT